MYTNTLAHPIHRPHAEALILRLAIYTQIYIHIHIHMCVNAYIYIYIHTCTYIHIYVHTYTLTHIYTSAYKMYRWTHAKHVWNDGAAATAREAQLDAKKLCPSPCPLGIPLVASSQITRPRGMTKKRRTTTTNSSSSHHHDSASSRPHPLICTGAEPIHPVHSPPNRRSWPWPSRPSDHFSACLAGFMCLRVRVCTCVCLRVCLYCCVGGWGCVTEPFLHQTLWMCHFCQARLYTNHHISIFYSSTSHVNTNVIKNKRSSQTIAHVLFSLL